MLHTRWFDTGSDREDIEPTVNQGRSEETRRAFLDAGRALVVERGGGQLPSIVEICSRAGYSRGAFYGHFRDREHYVEELLQEILDELADTLVHATVECPADLGGAVRHFVGAVRSPDSERSSELRRVYLSVLAEVREETAIRERHARAMRGVIDRLEAAIAEGQHAGQLRSEFGARDIATLLTLIGVTGVLWVDAGIPIDAESVGETLLQLLQSSPEEPPNP